MREWELARSRLAPIIGEDGFRVLFARSLHRARGEHPWLAHDPAQANLPFLSLKKSIESQSILRARLGSRALEEHFSELLHGLIGEDLAARLLGPT